ncbi:MAG: hypothetical protein K2X34_06060 [Hyphomonadaceae bacterium]|nr:hypothetical protein [Hyphomonadaceae bacterium]
MANDYKPPAQAVSFPQPASRLRREREQEKWRKTNARLADVQKAITESGGEFAFPLSANDAAAIVGAQHVLQLNAKYLEGLARYGSMQPKDVSLREVSSDEAAKHHTTSRNVETAMYARSERQIQMAVIALTIDWVLAFPGDNVEVCDVLWRIYEGYQDAEDGRRVPAWEPSGAPPGGGVTPERYARRKAAVSAAISAYMLAGLSETQAGQQVMQYVQRVPPSFFGMNAMELAASTAINWRQSFKKGRSDAAGALAQFEKWQKELIELRKSSPERLVPWATRLLHALVRRED